MPYTDTTGATFYFKQEPILQGDDFNNPIYRQDLESLAQVIQNLIIIEKGTYPNQPDLGVGIANYMFELLDSTTLYAVQTDIEEQIEQFISHNNISIKVNVKIIENITTTKANTLGISITILDLINDTTNEIDYVFAGNIKSKKIVSRLYYS